MFVIMPRTTPSDRLTKLLDAAAAAFVEHGFQRTQMDDIAERLGVSKGTIYRAVDSKEITVRRRDRMGRQPDDLPVDWSRRVHRRRAVAAGVAAELADAVVTLELTSIVASRNGCGPRPGFRRRDRAHHDRLYQLMRTGAPRSWSSTAAPARSPNSPPSGSVTAATPWSICGTTTSTLRSDH